MDDLICSTLPFTHISLADALTRVQQAGFRQIELPVRGDGVWPGHVDPERLADDPDYAADLSSTIARSGLQLMSAGCEMDKTIPLAEEMRRHRTLTRWLSEQGARYLTIFCYDSADKGERWGQLDAIARDAGLNLAVETHLGTATMYPHEAIALANELDLRITLDASHYVGQGFAPSDWAALESRVVAVQVSHCHAGELQVRSAPGDEAVVADRIGTLIPEHFTGPIICEQIKNKTDGEWDTQLAITRRALALVNLHQY